MRVSFACVVDHGEAHALAPRSVRVELEHGRCPVCAGQVLEGTPQGGLEWAHCPCCDATWRLEDDGFAVRSGALVEEWS